MYARRWAAIQRPQNADAKRIINAMAIRPGPPRQRLIDGVVKQLKGAGAWSLLDGWWLTAAHGNSGQPQAGTINWKNPGTWDLVPTNSPTFTPDRGFKGDGVGAYLVANGYNPATAGGNFTLNAGVLGAWFRQVGTIGNTSMVRGSSQLFFTLNVGPTTVQARVNDSTTSNFSPTTLAAGHYVARRIDAAGKDLWRDGALWTAKDASAPVALPINLYLLCFNATASFSDAEISGVYTGGKPTDAQMAAMHAAMQSYMQGVGAA